jgi:hypothetical protein
MTTIQTTTIDVTVPAFSIAKLAQLMIVDSQLGSAVAATVLFTSNDVLEIEALNSTGSLPSSNTTTGGTGGTGSSSSSCDALRMEVAKISERLSTTKCKPKPRRSCG